MGSLDNFFTECRELTDKTLNELIPSSETEPKELHEAIRWSVFAGGKRFRPALVLAVGRIFGADDAQLLCTAAAVEMIHTYSLIHDDLPAMDDDDLRRGRETCHIKFDEATAILAGDCLQALAFQAIAEDENLAHDIRVKLIAEIARAEGTPFGMVAGQYFDLQAEGKSISIEQLERIHQSKTGAMITVSAQAGAIIANSSENEFQAITNYSAKLGLLFQITDDLLDITQSTEVLGKTAGKDLVAEKATYPSLYGLEKAQELAQKVHAEACQELDKIEKDTEVLRLLVDFILHRKT
ncbi:MAG TPA: polyprenyl synthetase family protein [Pyrinomonadaceae bacterium]|nr:polyprenyl synthetase family protein [Pyrinomonadaceae bacterium]